MAEAYVEFVGAGPGAEDLITVRGLRALERADLVVYAGSLVNPDLLRRCPAHCVCRDSASLDLEEQIRIMTDAALQGKRVVRLHTGDPSVYGAIAEQMAALKERGVEARVVPGVSSVFGAAAALGCELTVPGGSQSVVLTRSPGRTPMPASENAAAFARTGATLVFFLSAGHFAELTEQLMREGGLSEETPAAVVYRATWPDERVLRGALGGIAGEAARAGIGRQAILLVGQALAGARQASRLYDPGFSHGYRNRLETERFTGPIALYAFSRNGLRRAQEIAAGLTGGAETEDAGELPVIYSSRRDAAEFGAEFVPAGRFDACLSAEWNRRAGHIFIGAAGIAVRKIAPLVRDKTRDPAVVICTENGARTISLLSGHLGGANRLARRVARITGGEAVISTATDVAGRPAVDEIAAAERARVVNPQAVKLVNAALLDNAGVAFLGPEDVFARRFSGQEGVEFVNCPDGTSFLENAHSWSCLVCWDRPVPEGLAVPVLEVRSAAWVLGAGCKRGVDPDALREVARIFLADNGLRPEHLACLASCERKADEPGLLALSNAWSVPFETHGAEALNAVPVPHPSQRVRDKVGSASVAEAGAMLSAVLRLKGAVPEAAGSGWNGVLQVPKTIRGDMTFALARIPHGRNRTEALREKGGLRGDSGRVTVAGLGSGNANQITPQVREALARCDTVAGYSGYLELIPGLLEGKTLIRSGMTGEVERCRSALEAAQQGREVCVVCSGDPGVLAMAGLLYELREADPALAGLRVEVLPGITAASLAAAALGAPLQNGFCAVSLSDLLVPAEEVRRNLNAVAGSDLPVALYNPAGRKRRALLRETLELFAARRGAKMLCALVRHAGRPGEEKWIGPLDELPEERVDMSTLIIVGGPRTRLSNGALYEARGYADKYPEARASGEAG